MRALFVLMAALAAGPAAAQSTLTGTTWLGELGMDLGRGYDSVTGEVRGECITRTTPTDNGAGVETEYGFDIIESSGKVRQLLDVSASASIQYGFLSAGGKASFFRETTITQSSVFAIAWMKHRKGAARMNGPALTPAANALLAAGKNAEFDKMCGDYFVYGIESGGEMYAIIRISTSSVQDAQNLKASLQLNAGIFRADAQLESAVTSALSNRSLEVAIFQSGGVGSKMIASVPEMLAKVRAFKAEANTNPVAYRSLVKPYGTVVLPSGAIVAEKTQKRRQIEQLADLYLGQRDDWESILYVDRHPTEFVLDATIKQGLMTAVSTIAANLRVVRQAYVGCAETPTCSQPQLQTYNLVLPQGVGQ